MWPVWLHKRQWKGTVITQKNEHHISKLDGNPDSEGEDLEEKKVLTPKMDLEAIDRDCFNLLGITEKCMISCNLKLSSKEECYKHMYLSPSKCCQKLCSNMEKSGFEEDIKKNGFQKVMLNHTLSQIL